MASTTKVTFTFDQATIGRLQDAAERLALPKSEIVREAIQEFHDRIGKLSESEKLRRLRTLDRIMARPRPPSRDIGDVDHELKEIRRARRSVGRRHPS